MGCDARLVGRLGTIECWLEGASYAKGFAEGWLDGADETKGGLPGGKLGAPVLANS